MKRWKWYLGGGIAAIVALMYFVPAPASIVTVRSRSGWPVGISNLNGIGTKESGFAPVLQRPPVANGLPVHSPPVLGFAPIGGYKLLARYHLVFKDKYGHVVADRWAPSDKQMSMWQGLEDLLGPSDAFAAACSACTTLTGATRLLGIFEGGVNYTSESEGNQTTGSFAGTVTNPMIVPGTFVATTATVAGNCTDTGAGTCQGASYTTATSTINYNTGAFTLTYGVNPGGSHAVTVSYKQYENWATCTLTQIAATGQGCWFVGLIPGTHGTPAVLSTTDTAASHAWTDVVLSNNSTSVAGGVTQGARQIWTGTGLVGNTTAAQDTNGASQVVYTSGTTSWQGTSSVADVTGIYLIDNNGSVSETIGTLDGEQQLSPTQPIGSQYTVNVTAQLSITAG